MKEAQQANRAMKTCSKCKVHKPLSEFRQARDKKDGHQSQCKECRKEYASANKEKIASQLARYYKANTESVRRKVKAYQLANKERIAEYWVAYASDERNANALKEYKANWFKRDYVSNPEKWRENAQRYYAANKAACAARLKRWKKENPEALRAWEAKRRAAKKAGGSFAAQDIKDLLALQRNKCPICRASLRHGYHVDHVIPLVSGGRNTRDNLQILCPRCNLKKNRKDPIDFMQINGFLL